MIFNMIAYGGGGERYSLLTVTTTEASLVGETVTVTATGTGAETESYTKTFTASKSLEFKLKQLTTYTITCGEANPKTLVVPYYADFTAEITLRLMLYDGSLGDDGADGANVCAAVTGGYNVRNQNQIYWNANDVTLKASNYANGQNIKTVNSINCAGYAFLKCEISGHWTFGIASSSSATDNAFIESIDDNDGVTSIDLTNYQGEYYVMVRCLRDNTAVVSQIWLE